MKKPLHVRVAEALGWHNLRTSRPEESRGAVWVGVPTERRPNLVSEPVPHYDTDWSVTGPLIERLELCVLREDHYVEGSGWLPWWSARYGKLTWNVTDSANFEPHGDYDPDGPPAHEAHAETPLIAVCNLVLALKEAGKLEPETTSAR